MAVARYRVVAEDLVRRIDEGEFPEGAQLPTEAQLMAQYENASRNTIRDAVKILIGRGLVATSPGRGTFVLKEVKPFAVTLASVPAAPGPGGGEGKAYEFDATLQNRSFENTPPRVEIKKAAGEIARALELESGTRVVVRHQERRIDASRPWSMQTSFYPMRFVTEGAERLLDAEDIPEGVVAYLKRELDVEQVAYRDRITARVPDGNEAAFFNLPDTGSVVIVHDRIAYDRDKHPIRFTNTVYPADRNHLYLEVGEVPGSSMPETALHGQESADFPDSSGGHETKESSK